MVDTLVAKRVHGDEDMCWTASGVVDQRRRFVRKYESDAVKFQWKSLEAPTFTCRVQSRRDDLKVAQDAVLGKQSK